MGRATPKQFLLLNNLPVLMQTINAFSKVVLEADITVVLPKEEMPSWHQLCEKYAFKTPHLLVSGGSTRFHSVKNGLSTVKPDTLVAIHDGVRPCVSAKTITSCFEAALTYGAAVPVLAVKESLRKIHHNQSHAVDRNMYRVVQTPQCFQYDVITSAYNQKYKDSFTDDASVVEAAGHQIKLVEGNEENIKITTPADLIIAEALHKAIS